MRPLLYDIGKGEPGSLLKTKSAADEKAVYVTGIEIPFWDLVTFLVKFAIACIPATIILWILGALFGGFLLSFLRGLTR